MHAGLLHIAGNMIFLWAFAPEIEDAMGRFRFLVFYLAGGLVASLAQIMMIPQSDVPNLGASGAIAAVMWAFLVSFPFDRIRTFRSSKRSRSVRRVGADEDLTLHGRRSLLDCRRAGVTVISSIGLDRRRAAYMID
jgi:membrane associated rhomboid family serine protease